MATNKFNIEDFIVEKKTQNVYFVMGSPITCTIKATNEKAYVVADRLGNTFIYTQEELENGDFIKRKGNHPKL